MKLITLGFILICCNAWATSTYKNVLEDILIKFKTQLKTGNEKLGLPILDPYRADQLDINFNEDIIKLNATLKKIGVNGLSVYDIIKADFKPNYYISTTIHLSWPLVVVSTNYSANVTADELELYGKGQINMFAHYLAFETHIDFITDGGFNGYLKIKEMKLNLSLKSLDFQATGLYNDDELSKVLSYVISDMAPKFLSDEMVVNRVTQIVRKKFDSVLSSIRILDLLTLLL